MIEDLGATLSAMLAAVSSADTAEEAWRQVLTAGREAGGAVPDDFAFIDATADVENIARQIRSIFSSSPTPEDLTFIYFGLFAAVDQRSGGEAPGFYLAGGTTAAFPPAVEGGDSLTYLPPNRFLRGSRLLDLIKAEALRGGPDYNFFDYALMLAAASILAKFVLRKEGITKHLIVGFDSGDKLLVP